MDLSNIRTLMLNAATSAMTKIPKDREMILSDIGNGHLLTLEDNQENSLMINVDGTVEDINFCDLGEETDEKMTQKLKDDPSRISLYFSYRFGGGQPTFVRKNNKFVMAPPEKTVENWRDAFIDGDDNAWEETVIGKLSKIDPRFSYAQIDYDSDFGYQGVILSISKFAKKVFEDE